MSVADVKGAGGCFSEDVGPQRRFAGETACDAGDGLRSRLLSRLRLDRLADQDLIITERLDAHGPGHILSRRETKLHTAQQVTSGKRCRPRAGFRQRQESQREHEGVVDFVRRLWLPNDPLTLQGEQESPVDREVWRRWTEATQISGGVVCQREDG